MPVKKTVNKKITKPKVKIDASLDNCCDINSKCKTSCSPGGFLYFLGFIGAAWYYISTATGFWMGVWGVIKAIVWPALLIYAWMKQMGL